MLDRTYENGAEHTRHGIRACATPPFIFIHATSTAVRTVLTLVGYNVVVVFYSGLGEGVHAHTCVHAGMRSPQVVPRPVVFPSVWPLCGHDGSARNPGRDVAALGVTVQGMFLTRA